MADGQMRRKAASADAAKQSKANQQIDLAYLSSDPSEKAQIIVCHGGNPATHSEGGGKGVRRPNMLQNA